MPRKVTYLRFLKAWLNFSQKIDRSDYCIVITKLFCRIHTRLLFHYVTKGGEKFLNSLTKGDFFGEKALEGGDGKRTANIIAGNGDAGKISKKWFDELQIHLTKYAKSLCIFR